MVLPALRRAPADCGRHRAVRPLLVQSRGRRARNGILHRRSRSACFCATRRSSRRCWCATAFSCSSSISTIGREMQLKRFHERRHSPFKRWKITEIDLAAIEKWDDYSRKHSATSSPVSPHTVIAPWTPAIRANDQRRALWRPSAPCWVRDELRRQGRERRRRARSQHRGRRAGLLLHGLSASAACGATSRAATLRLRPGARPQRTRNSGHSSTSRQAGAGSPPPDTT